LGRIAGLSLLAWGFAEAPGLTPLPAPLASFVASHPQARLTVMASGLTEARNLRLQSDGSVWLDAPGDSLEYRVTPRAEGNTEVLLAAREMSDERSLVTPGLATLVDLEWLPRDATFNDDVELPAEILVAVGALAHAPDTEFALAPDGTLFVAALDAGFLYEVTFPAATSRQTRLERQERRGR
jgi:hypothetical protein